MYVGRLAYLLHLYYGPRINDTELTHLIQLRDRDFDGNPYEDGYVDRTFSLRVVQPGSTVRTQLRCPVKTCHAIGVLSVRIDDYEFIPMPLNSPRPFLYRIEEATPLSLCRNDALGAIRLILREMLESRSDSDPVDPTYELNRAPIPVPKS
jgi:hypothetical protein